MSLFADRLVVDIGNVNMKRKSIFTRKSIDSFTEKQGAETHGLRRHLTSFHLTTIGIGAIVGAGIFVIIGAASANYAGPGVIVSFMIAAVICLLTGLCYAELSSLIPSSGGSYSYSYVAMGEFPAWIVGWTLTAQCLISASTVAVGWSGYFISLLNDFGIHLPTAFTQAPVAYNAAGGLSLSGAILNVPALCLVALLGVLLCVGIRAAARFNNFMVILKLSAITLFILVGIPFINSENWVPFIPENTGIFGQFGWSGVVRASGLVFFAYIGFDTVATLAQESVNPQRDLPRGILGSLCIATVVYIVTGLVLTGLASYTLLGVPDPMSIGLNALGPALFWLKILIKLMIWVGLTSVVLVQLLGQTRIFYAISRDGLLPKAFASVNSKLGTPVFATITTAIISMIAASLFPIEVLGELVSMATLFLFTIVCLGVLILRKTHPEYKRSFKVPFVPVLPILGMVACIAQMSFLQRFTWMQFMGWLMVGLIIYFGYSVKKSHLRKHEITKV